MVQRDDRSRGRGVTQGLLQRAELGPAHHAVTGTGNQAVEGDHPEATGHADGRALVVQSIQQDTGVRAARVTVPGAERGREAGPPVVVSGGIDVRDATAGGELADPVPDRGASLGRAVVSDIAGDHDQVQASEMAAIAQDLVERAECGDAIRVEAGRGGVGVGQVQDPVGHETPARSQSTQAADALRVTPRW
jgi:hypothetical protein